MPDQDPGTLAARKATGITRGLPKWKEDMAAALMAGIDGVMGAVGIGGDSKASQVGELLSAAAPILGATKALTIGKLAAKRIATPIRAYHGSPHDFDEFSLSKIGTGEGAQAYGHGLYFAESPEVAESYKKALVAQHGLNTPAKRVSVDGAPLAENPQFQSLSDRAKKRVQSALSFDSDRNKALRTLKYQIGQPQADQGAIREAVSFVQALPDSVAMAPRNQGRMYEVNIHANPDDFLDWDAPLSQQSEKVRQAVGKVAPTMEQKAFTTKPLPDGRVQILSPTGDSMGYYKPHEVAESLENLRAGYMGRGLGQRSLTGGDLIERGKSLSMKDDLSHELKQAGIPGIKYLDRASRSAGQGSRNYVVFDDQLVEVVKKYGIAGALSAGLINQAQAQQMQAQGLDRPTSPRPLSRLSGTPVKP